MEVLLPVLFVFTFHGFELSPIQMLVGYFQRSTQSQFTDSPVLILFSKIRVSSTRKMYLPSPEFYVRP